MRFNGIEKSYITVMRGRVRPFFASENSRLIKVPVHIRHSGFAHFEKLKEEISFWLIHEEPKSLEFEDDPDRVYFAKVTDIEIEETHRLGSDVIIHFSCDSKYSLERTLTINDQLSSKIAGHKSTPWKSKTTFTEAKTGYELIFNSPGKTELREINKIKLNYNFIRGDVLEIDYSKRKVTVNGRDITNTVVILQSNFMELPIGDVEFVVDHKTEFYYYERYY